MLDSKKHIFDDFQKYLVTDFQNYCQRHEYKISHDRFVTFLIDKGLIPESAVCRYTVQREFERITAAQKAQKTKTVLKIHDKYHISEKTIWNVLRRVGAKK